MPCTSYTWIARGSSGRYGGDIVGNDTAMVKLGNCCALYLSALCTYLHAQGVYYCIEQPLASCLKDMPCMVSLQARTKHIRLCTWMGAFGGKLVTPKGVHLFS